jgi:ribosomal protein L30/L7E
VAELVISIVDVNEPARMIIIQLGLVNSRDIWLVKENKEIKETLEIVTNGVIGRSSPRT